MKSVSFARLAAVLSVALAVGCGSDETDDGNNGPSGGGGEGGNGVGAGPGSSSTGSPTSSSASTGVGASGGSSDGGAGVGGAGGSADGGAGVGGAGVGGAGVGGAGGDTNGGAGVGGNSGTETCGNGIDDDNDTLADCVDSDCSSTPYCTISTWTCSAGYFNEAANPTIPSPYCDCSCGQHDPDCDIPTVTNTWCGGSPPATGQTCVNDVCTAPTGWTCLAGDYDEVSQGTANPECDCGCGVPDPDCEDATLAVVGCPSGQACTSAGVCDPVPAAWTCTDAWFDEAGQGDPPYCDCSCGAHDPDCDIVPAVTLTCAGATPEAGQECVSDVCDAPTAWTCMPAYYDEVGQGAANPLCDCECGFPDPDCAVDPPLGVEGCLAGEICNDAGTCETPVVVVPPGWVCNDIFYDDVAHGNSTVYCDCSCGAHDPDCDLPAVDLDGLYCGDNPAMAGQVCTNDVCVP